VAFFGAHDAAELRASAATRRQQVTSERRPAGEHEHATERSTGPGDTTDDGLPGSFAKG